MDTSFLVRPAPVFRQSYIEALREGFAWMASPMDEEQIAQVEADIGAHLAILDYDGQKTHEEFGRIMPSAPSNTFWLVDNMEFVGAVNIRARIDTYVLARLGGHVGYGIRPSMRRRGYGKRMLALALQVCRGMGLGVVRIGCAEANPASRRIIEASGGILLRRCKPDWYAPEPYLLFEILTI